jgi:hypothetical protein
MLGSENCGELTGPIVISLIGAPLAADDVGADDDDAVADADADGAAAELDELEPLLPHAAAASALAMVIASTTRRWFTASLLNRFNDLAAKTKGCTSL